MVLGNHRLITERRQSDAALEAELAAHEAQGRTVTLLADASGVRRAKAVKVKPVDTVGAGDCFTAWLAVGLAEGLSLDTAAQRAMKAASIAVTRPGAQPGMPYRTELA